MFNFRQFLETEQDRYTSIKANIPLPAEVQQINNLFRKHNKSLFVVGGAVRDFLFDKMHNPKKRYSPKDIDLATEAPPQEVIKILQSDPSIKVFPKGEAFGVISAVINNKEYEIATFRSEYYNPETGSGRRPDEVSFSTPGKDAQRRDLTMNALFYDIQNQEIRDYNLTPQGEGQGILDIKNKVSRPVGNPAERFREDKLRIPRLIRFFSKYNPGDILSHLDQETLKAIELFKELKGVSPERIANEFLMGLEKAQHPVNYLKNYAVLGLFSVVFPGMRVDVQDLDRIGNIRNPRAVLAWILKSNSRVKQQLNKFKYPSEIFERVEFLLELFRFDPAKIVAYLRKRDIYKQDPLPEMQSQKKATTEQDIMDFARIAGMEPQLRHFLSYRPTVRSQDYTHLTGPEIGKAMSDAERQAYLKSLNK